MSSATNFSLKMEECYGVNPERNIYFFRNNSGIDNSRRKFLNGRILQMLWNAFAIVEIKLDKKFPCFFPKFKCHYSMINLWTSTRLSPYKRDNKTLKCSIFMNYNCSWIENWRYFDSFEKLRYSNKIYTIPDKF